MDMKDAKDTLVLVVDDDEKLRDLVVEYLGSYGYATATLPDGREAVETVERLGPDMVILDVMMPGPDGFEVLRELRGRFAVPVLMLTAKGDDMDRVLGLEMGADDYLPKPFNPRELLARIKAVLRRTPEGAESHDEAGIVAVDGLRLDTTRHLLASESQTVDLSTTECRLLAVLMRRPGRVQSRDDLMNKVWDREFTAYDRSIDVHISKLRAKLAALPGGQDRIKTVWGAGYTFVGES
jgi:two-component system phosphate regulon response regulator OmpR